MKLLRFKDLAEIIPLSRTTLWRHVRAGSFPAPIKIGVNSRAWREEDIARWINEKTVETTKNLGPKK